MTYVFFACILLGLYPYLFYPVCAWLLGAVLRRHVRVDPGAPLPRVTVVTAAFNEAAHIEATVRNKLEQDYPRELLDVIVISDESVDGTDEIVARIAAEDPRVRLMRQVPRAGKTSGLNLAMPQVRGDIVLFSDANSIYDRSALRTLVRNFSDPRVGYVSGQMKYVNPDGSMVGDGCTAYMRYENFLRSVETRIGSIVGVDGGVDAVRRQLYQPMRADQLPDFVLPLNVVEQGYRVVFEPDAVLREDALNSQSSEYRMRVRVALRAFWALWDKRGLLNPFRTGWFAWQLFSHKVLRYLAFAPLALAAVLNWFLLGDGPVFVVAAAGQVAFVLLALAGMSGARAFAGLALPALCHYFLLLNWASAVAFLGFLRGEKKLLWQPRQG
jgi:cellulose synthase/poly-beta-1,6-N-acetylglucosamine synthase-like glycosyltransferase